MKLSLFSLAHSALASGFAVLLSTLPLSAQAPPPPPPPPNSVFMITSDVKVVKGAPYSATSTTTLTQTLANGTHIVQTQQATLARDTAGRTRREETLQNVGPWSTAQAPRSIVFISDPVAQVQYVMEPEAQTATRSSLAPGTSSVRGQKLAAEATAKRMVIVSSASAGGGPSSAAMGLPTLDSRGGAVAVIASDSAEGKVETLPDQVMEGLTVHGKRVTSTIPAGAMGNDQPIVMTSETWYSPDLQMTILSKHSDPRVGETVTALSGVSRTEPAASLFQVPANYTVKESDVPGEGEVHLTIQQ